MRTTLTIDDDLADSLKQQARLNNLPFKQVVNETLRRGLKQETNGEKPPFEVKPVDSADRPDSVPKYYKRILDDEDLQHYMELQVR